MPGDQHVVGVGLGHTRGDGADPGLGDQFYSHPSPWVHGLEIVDELRQILDDATDKWGVRVVRVELQRIEPPADVTDAMHRQMKAERDRRAQVTEAEGGKAAAILRAEGIQQSQILEATGQAEAIKRVADAEQYQLLTVAEGEGQAIERVFSAIHNGDPTPDLIAIRYLEALERVANGQATKIFLPLDTSGVLGSVAAIGEMFRDTSTDTTP